MRSDIIQITKAVLAAVIISLTFVLVFTVIIQLFSLSVTIIKPVNQIFKILAVAGGGILFIKGDSGLLKGAIYGVIAVAATYFLYALISTSLSLSWKFAAELLIGAFSGGISGVIAVNIKK